VLLAHEIEAISGRRLALFGAAAFLLLRSPAPTL
jgi:hypothetical protein